MCAKILNTSRYNVQGNDNKSNAELVSKYTEDRTS